MSKKKIILIAGACVLAAVCAAGIYFAPQIRSVMSLAQGAVMDEQARTEMEEENRRLEQELRDKYAVPEGEVNAEINEGVLDGTLTLEEAARQWLEQHGETDLSQAAGGEDANLSNDGADANLSDGESGSGVSVTENRGDAAADSQKAAEDAQKPAEQKAAEDAQKAAEQKAAEDAQKAAEQKAAEDAQKAAEQKAAEDAQKAAEQKAAQEAQKTAEQKAAEEAAAKEAAAKAEKDAKIQNLVAQAQVLRSVFTSRLDGVVESCKNEFMALPVEEQTTANKVKIVTGRLGEVADMEEECNAQIATIVSQLQELDPDTAAAVQNQYEREKMAKKTALLNEYRNGAAN